MRIIKFFFRGGILPSILIGITLIILNIKEHHDFVIYALILWSGICCIIMISIIQIVTNLSNEFVAFLQEVRDATLSKTKKEKDQ